MSLDIKNFYEGTDFQAAVTKDATRFLPKTGIITLLGRPCKDEFPRCFWYAEYCDRSYRALSVSENSQFLAAYEYANVDACQGRQIINPPAVSGLMVFSAELFSIFKHQFSRYIVS